MINIVITLKHKSNSKQVIKKLKKIGFKLETVLETIEVITGKIDSKSIHLVLEIDEVASVELDKDSELN